MKKIILVILCIVFSFSYAISQIHNPIRWTFATKRLNATEGIIFVKANMSKTWYIYGLNVPNGGPTPTSITFNENKDYSLKGKLLEPKAKNKYESVFKQNIPYHIEEVVFQQKINLKSKGPITLSGKITFMTCNDKNCLPADDKEFVIKII